MDDDRSEEPAGGDGEHDEPKSDEPQADEPDSDEPEADEPDSDEPEADEPDAPPSQDQRLEQVGERIDKARAKAEEELGEPGQPFVESGDEQSEQQDDQTIAPPG